MYDNTPLALDAKRILQSDMSGIRESVIAYIHSGEVDYTVLSITHIDRIRDYLNGLGDEIFIEVKIPLGDYIKFITPNADHLEMTLRYYPADGLSPVKSTDRNRYERYKLVLTSDNPKYNLSEYDYAGQELLNMADILDIKFQLLNRGLEILRIKRTEGVFTNVNRESFLRAVIGAEINKIRVDGKAVATGVSISKPSNLTPIKQLIIPSNTLVSSIPSIVQSRYNGLYTAGAGIYFQSYKGEPLVFVYPLRDTTRFNETPRKAIIYFAPVNRYPGVENTFMLTGETLKILATSKKAFLPNPNGELNAGAGFTMADSRSVMREAALPTTAGPVGKPEQIMHDVVMAERKDGVTTTAIKGANSNVFNQYASLLETNGHGLLIHWENSDDRYLYPGMPIQYVYLKENKVTTIDGTLVHTHTHTTGDGMGPFSTTLRTHTLLTIYVKETP